MAPMTKEMASTLAAASAVRTKERMLKIFFRPLNGSSLVTSGSTLLAVTRNPICP